MTEQGAPRRRNTVLAALEAARRRYPEISLKGLTAFLYVAESPGIQIVEIAEVMDLFLPTASRVVRALCDEATPSALGPQLGLLRLEHPVGAGAGAGRQIVLTSAGRALASELDRLIERSQPIQVKPRVEAKIVAIR